MHHQRSACEASTRASIGQAERGRNGGSATHASTSIADQQPGVQHHHERVVAAARSRRRRARKLQAALRVRDDQLGEPLERRPARPGP